jgi:hypothetical protein
MKADGVLTIKPAFYPPNHALPHGSRLAVTCTCRKLRRIAGEAVVAGKAAGLFGDEKHLLPSHLGIRCVEMLEYNSGNGFASVLGWHEDTESIYTMVLALSAQGTNFTGGAFHIQGGSDLQRKHSRANAVKREVEAGASEGGDARAHPTVLDVTIEPTEGSGMIFDSETSHGVGSLDSGVRTVLVLEFWPLADATAGDLRPGLEYGAPLPVLPAELPYGCIGSDGVNDDGGVYRRSCWRGEQ